MLTCTFEFFKLFIKYLSGSFVPFFCTCTLLKISNILFRRTSTQFILNCFHLLLKEILTLLLINAFFCFVLNRHFKLQELRFFVQQFEQLISALHDFVGLKQTNFFLYIQPEIGTHIIDKEKRIFDILNRKRSFQRHNA